MLYLYHGNNTKKIQQQVQHIVQTLKTKRPDAQVFHIHADTFSIDDFEGITMSQGLFFDKHVFLCFGLLNGKKEIRDYILKSIPQLIQSPHIFIYTEEDLDQKTIDIISEYKEVKIQLHNDGVSKIKEDMSKRAFPIVHTYAELLSVPHEKRTHIQKLRAWQAVDSIRVLGVPPEEFFGILWWKYKTILQALGATQKESGLTPYSYTQAKKLADTYGPRVKTDMGVLLNIYHEAHMGELDMWEELEGLVLR